MYPGLPPGTATVLKAHLVSNALLAQLSTRYRLHERIIAAPASLHSLRNSERARANLFEALIAGIYMDRLRNGDRWTKNPALAAPGRAQAMETTITWLDSIFTPIAAHALQEMRRKKQELTMLEAQAAAEAAKGSGGADVVHDKDADGAMAILNEHFIRIHGAKPDYPATQMALDSWQVDCTATTRDGEK